MRNPKRFGEYLKMATKYDVTWIFIVLILGLSGALSACDGCANNKAFCPSPAPPLKPTRLSVAFAANCASCHGADGSGSDSSNNRSLVKTTLSASAYSAKVRSGVSSPSYGSNVMVAYPASTIPDGDIAADYAFFTK